MNVNASHLDGARWKLAGCEFRIKGTVLCGLVLLTLAGFLLRLASFHYNIYLHGDLFLHCATTETVARTGHFMVPFPGSHAELIDNLGWWGYPVDQHPPLWPAVGSLVYRMTDDCFAALKLLSLAAGLTLIPLSFLFARRLFDTSVAWLTAIAVAVSYLLIDYSANGAVYVLQADMFLLFVLAASNPARLRNWAVLGALAGGAYLLNYQAVVIGLSLPLLYLAVYGRHVVRRWNVLKLTVALSVAFAVISPWLWRNYRVFGDPIYSINMTYFWGKLHGVLGVPGTASVSWQAMVKVVAWWSTHNVYYLARKLFILAPVAFAFTILAVPSFLSRMVWEDRADDWALTILMVLYVAVCALWPVVKFRYFVPLLPVAFTLGFWHMGKIRLPHWRRLATGATLLATILFSALTFLSIPSRTYYYDGAITTDLFGKRGEANYVTGLQPLLDVAAFLRTQPAGPVSGDIRLHYYSDLPVTRGKLSAGLIDHYGVRYIVTDITSSTLDEFTNWKPIYANEKYQVLARR